MARGSLSRLSERARNMPARALEVLRREGVAGLRIRALDATVYRHLLISRRVLSIPTRGGVELPRGIELTFLEADGADEYAVFRPDAEPAETERRLGAGHRCIVARRGGRIIHARWFSPDRLESAYLGLAFELPSDTVYAHDIFTAPDARRQGISVAAASLYRDTCLAEGYRTALGSLWPGNSPGAAMLRANGQELIGAVGAIKLGARRIPILRWMPEGHLGRAHRFEPGR
jgi:GNAT superfamily N-acetyltransferase